MPGDEAWTRRFASSLFRRISGRLVSGACVPTGRASYDARSHGSPTSISRARPAVTRGRSLSSGCSRSAAEANDCSRDRMRRHAGREAGGSAHSGGDRQLPDGEREARDLAGCRVAMKHALGRRLVDGASRAQQAFRRLAGIARRDRLSQPSHVGADARTNRRISSLTLDALPMTLLRGWMLVHSGGASSSRPHGRQ